MSAKISSKVHLWKWMFAKNLCSRSFYTWLIEVCCLLIAVKLKLSHLIFVNVKHCKFWLLAWTNRLLNIFQIWRRWRVWMLWVNEVERNRVWTSRAAIKWEENSFQILLYCSAFDVTEKHRACPRNSSVHWML